MAPNLPFVCVPGTLCDERVFEPVLARLPPREVVWAALENVASVEAAAQALLAAAPPRFIIMGFSLGGFVAIEAMRRAPQRIAGAVMISSNAHPDLPQNADLRRAQLTLARESGMAALVEVLWPGYAVSRPGLKADVLAMAQAVGAETLAGQTQIAISRPDRRAWAAQQPAPMLVICGEQDALCPPARYEALAASPAASLAVIAGAGHFVLLEDPGKTAAAIGGWLAPLEETAQTPQRRVNPCS